MAAARPRAPLLGGSGTCGLSSIQMNPQLSHRKNTLLDSSAMTVRAVWSHTGQRTVVKSSGGRLFGSLKNDMGFQRCHFHVY